MSRVYPTIVFWCSLLAGLGLIAYGVLARRRAGSKGSEKLPLGFSGSPRQPFELLDLDMGHEGLTHREKERFDPGRHRPQPIMSGKNCAEGAPVSGQTNKPVKIDIA